METIKENVKYQFEPTELVVIAKDQARVMNDKTALEEQFDQLRADHKGKIAKADADISACTRRITAGYEMRSVKCIVVKARPPLPDHVLVIRTDNGHVLRKRKLNDDEKQMKLTTEEPDPWVFEVDLFEDNDSDVADMVAEGVPITEKESVELRDVLEMRPARKMIEG